MDSESSVELLERVRQGDRGALDCLLRRYVPALRRWASGRLPRVMRDASDTDDLVQDVVLRSLQRINGFEHRREGALQAYLRQAVLNRIRDEYRKFHRRPAIAGLDDEVRDQGLSPLENAIGVQAVERYEQALARLRDEDREAITGRIEMGYSYEELAVMLGKSSPDAARMTVSRALIKLAEVMHDAG